MINIKKFEKFIKVNEGAWGHGPLDNDSASDWKWEIGDVIIKKIKDKITESKKSNRLNGLYEAIGMWDFISENLKTQYSFFSTDEVKEMNSLCLDIIEDLYEKDFANTYKDTGKVEEHLSELNSKFSTNSNT